MILDELIKLMEAEAEAEDICFNPGASELSVESLESVIEQDLPDDYWTFLHEHDGQRRDTKPLLGVYRLMSINEMEIEYIRRVDEARKGTQIGMPVCPMSECKLGWIGGQVGYFRTRRR